MPTRADIAHSAADQLLAAPAAGGACAAGGAAVPSARSAPPPASPSALVGFDGFLDAITHVVATRRSMRPDDFERLATIPDFAARAAGAAGKSTNMEVAVQEVRFGGNGPLMAGGLAALGLPTTYIGCIGSPDAPREIHPAFLSFADRCRASGGAVHAVAPPGRTDAFEFDDGKLMFNNPGPLYHVVWADVVAAVGEARLASLVREASLIGVVNWTIMAAVEDLWHGLVGLIARLPAGSPRPRVFIDLSDPAKRTDTDIARALGVLRDWNAPAPVTLGLNLAEAQRIDRVLGAGGFMAAAPDGPAVCTAAARICAAAGLECVVIHPREGAAAATAAGESHWFDGPLVGTPRLSTGGGDHFNAGFAAAQVLGLALPECLAAATATSGAYVRDGQSPTRARVAELLRSQS